MLPSNSNFVSYCLSAESLELGRGMLLAHPDVKDIKLKHLSFTSNAVPAA